MPVPRSTPEALLGRMKQQPLLSARVKCDREIGEAAGGGGGAQLSHPGSVASAPHPHHIPRPWWPRSAAIPMQHVPKGAQGVMGESPLSVTQGGMSAHGDSPGLSHQGQSGWAPSRRQLVPVCGSDSDH